MGNVFKLLGMLLTLGSVGLAVYFSADALLQSDAGREMLPDSVERPDKYMSKDMRARAEFAVFVAKHSGALRAAEACETDQTICVRVRAAWEELPGAEQRTLAKNLWIKWSQVCVRHKLATKVTDCALRLLDPVGKVIGRSAEGGWEVELVGEGR